MKRTFEVENAFQKIKATTGFSDVQEIVHKFLTREQTYTQLLMAVSENERKIDNQRKENEHWREKLHELQMDISSSANDNLKTLNPDIEKLDEEIVGKSKLLEKVVEINKKVQLVND